MFVYSKNIIRFIHEIKKTVKEIILKEIGLRVSGDRFYDRLETASYPIYVVVYNHKSMLGYFDPNFYQLGFHESLMHTSRKQLHDVIRHELAHYMTFITHGGIQPHSPEFRAFCHKMGWGEEVYKATTCLESGGGIFEGEESVIFRKIQKLMALSASSNKHEAELAMIKAQQLLLKHNIESKYLGTEDDEKLFLKRIMKQKKENAKMRSIALILGTFFVSTVYTRGGGFIYLEIMGDAVNVEIAEHVASVLDVELDNLWNQARKQANLRGMVAKNSFFHGLARGYCNKIQALKKDYNSDVANALMVIEGKLADAKAMVYSRLSSSKSSGYHCSQSSALGEQMGRGLTINPALNQQSRESAGLLIACDSE